MTLVCLDMDDRRDVVTVDDRDYFGEMQQRLDETDAKIEQLQTQLNRIETLLRERLPLVKRLPDDY